MATYIDQIPTGVIVVVGVIDEGANSLTAAAWTALYKIGLT